MEAEADQYKPAKGRGRGRAKPVAVVGRGRGRSRVRNTSSESDGPVARPAEAEKEEPQEMKGFKARPLAEALLLAPPVEWPIKLTTWPIPPLSKQQPKTLEEEAVDKERTRVERRKQDDQMASLDRVYREVLRQKREREEARKAKKAMLQEPVFKELGPHETQVPHKGFVFPYEVKLPDSKLKEGLAIDCCVYEYRSPSDISLMLYSDYACGQSQMTIQFTKKINSVWKNPAFERNRLVPKVNYIQVGAIFAILTGTDFEGIPGHEPFEWIRAQVCEVPRDLQQPIKFYCFDNGKFYEVHREQVCFMHKDLMSKSHRIHIRARLALSSHYQPYHTGEWAWPEGVVKDFKDLLKHQSFRTHFVRKIDAGPGDMEDLWEISIEHFWKHNEGFDIKGDRMEKQFLRHVFGEYLEDETQGTGEGEGAKLLSFGIDELK